MWKRGLSSFENRISSGKRLKRSDLMFNSVAVKSTRFRFVHTSGASKVVNSNTRKFHTKYRYSKLLGKCVLGLLVPYTGYALYVTISAAQEIDMRHKKCLELDTLHSTEGTLIKYSPLQVFGRFENPFVEYRIQTIYEFFFNRVVELFERNRGGIPPDERQMIKLMPVHQPQWSETNDSDCVTNYKILTKMDTVALMDEELPRDNLNDADIIPIYNTWLGQSCNYVIYNDLKILTDPIFSDHLIHESLGPKRISGMPCTVEQVPQPDIILVSHNHPDHLDFKSLNYWQNKDDTLWIIPKGMNKFFLKHHVTNFIELSWWETCQLKTKSGETYNITSTPAMHWSGRSVLDTNESIWCSFMLTHNNKPILFHAGDTGYVKDLYVRIKQVFGGGCRLALLPCGQYCPEWHQKPRHINPQEVIKIMQDMSIQNVLGVHWGTFLLSGEYFLERKERLERLAEFEGIRERCYCPELGKTEKF
ncbi:N-acyl-phosphatidylethanolamine-hydrolyzing phospholipase D, mitochondrial [Monosporozyma servazzii]